MSEVLSHVIESLNIISHREGRAIVVMKAWDIVSLYSYETTTNRTKHRVFFSAWSRTTLL